MKWQPIETAPLSVPILVFIPYEASESRITVGMIDSEGKALVMGWLHSSYDLPTKWHPLPPPPEDV